MLCVMERMPAFAHLQSEISDLKSQCESISRQIRAWTDSLQNSEIKGQRHLNDKTRKQYEQSQRKSEFWQRMDQFKQDQEARLNREAAERNRKASENDADTESPGHVTPDLPCRDFKSKISNPATPKPIATTDSLGRSQS